MQCYTHVQQIASSLDSEQWSVKITNDEKSFERQIIFLEEMITCFKNEIFE